MPAEKQVIAEYALKRTDGSISIAEYSLMSNLPKEFKNDFPTIDMLESEPTKKLQLNNNNP